MIAKGWIEAKVLGAIESGKSMAMTAREWKRIEAEGITGLKMGKKRRA
jgi:hypothetical protein